MEDFVLIAASLKLGYAAVAVLIAVLFARWLDLRAKVDFTTMMTELQRTPMAAAVYFGLRIVAICVLIGMVVGCTSAQAGPLFSSRYDAQIRTSVDRYWPDHPDWLVWKAQLVQESRLDPSARSPVGAAGLAQFMPGTWREIAAQMRLPPGASPHQDIAIDAGAYYMARLRRIWTEPRSADDRQRLAQASYNAGAGHILNAQRRCGGRSWAEISPCLVQVTGPQHSRETLGYITSIARWRAMMAAGG